MSGVGDIDGESDLTGLAAPVCSGIPDSAMAREIW
jgi:hypothetical protein